MLACAIRSFRQRGLPRVSAPPPQPPSAAAAAARSAAHTHCLSRKEANVFFCYHHPWRSLGNGSDASKSADRGGGADPRESAQRRWDDHGADPLESAQRRRDNRGADPLESAQRRRDLDYFRHSAAPSDAASAAAAGAEDAAPGGGADNVHLNPAAFHDLLASARRRSGLARASEAEAGRHRRAALRVSVIGIPNAGKSTLINRLVGSAVCPHSAKTHTTRRNSKAILTKEETQLVFLDTPGVLSREDIARFDISDLAPYPARAVREADVILVLQDVSSRFSREAVNKDVLRLLCAHHRIPAVLVLNKIDTMPQRRRVIDLIRKLTCNHLEGGRQGARVVKDVRPPSGDKYLKQWRLKHSADGPAKKTAENYTKLFEKNSHSAGAECQVTVQSYPHLVQILQKPGLTSGEIANLTQGLIGWPGFRDVFVVSALHGSGVDELREYLTSSAVAGRPWQFPPQIRTDVDPRDIVVDTVKSCLLEHVAGWISYGLEPRISSWEVVNDTLRLLISVDSHKPEVTRALLRGSGKSTLRLVSKAAETELQKFFHTDTFVMMEVKVLHSAPARKHEVKEQPVDMFL